MLRASDIYYNGGAVVNQETITIHLSNNVSPVEVADAVEKYTLRFTLTNLRVWFETAFEPPRGNEAIVRVTYNNTNIFSNPDTLLIPEGYSEVGPIMPVVNKFEPGGVLSFDIRKVGTIRSGKGYKVTIQGTRS